MILIEDTLIEKSLKQLLQCDIKLCFGNRVWRSGKLLLFKQSGFYIELVIQSNKLERFEIPIPYNIKTSKNNNVVVFDYMLNTLTFGNDKITKLIGDISFNTKKSRFYDTVLNIEFERF